MSDVCWLILGFLLRTLFRPFALEFARAWYKLTFRIVSVGVGREARSLWEDEVFGDLELEIWEGLKDPRLSRQDVAVGVAQRSLDLLWNGWTERAVYVADAERARAALAQSEDDTATRDRRLGWLDTSIKLWVAMTRDIFSRNARELRFAFITGPLGSLVVLTAAFVGGSTVAALAGVAVGVLGLASTALAVALVPWLRTRRRRP